MSNERLFNRSYYGGLVVNFVYTAACGFRSVVETTTSPEEALAIFRRFEIEAWDIPGIECYRLTIHGGGDLLKNQQRSFK